jgi:hypothetical protein
MFVPPTIIPNQPFRNILIPPGLKAIGATIPIVTWGGYSFYPFSYTVITKKESERMESIERKRG